MSQKRHRRTTRRRIFQRNPEKLMNHPVHRPTNQNFCGRNYTLLLNTFYTNIQKQSQVNCEPLNPPFSAVESASPGGFVGVQRGVSDMKTRLMCCMTIWKFGCPMLSCRLNCSRRGEQRGVGAEVPRSAGPDFDPSSQGVGNVPVAYDTGEKRCAMLEWRLKNRCHKESQRTFRLTQIIL